MNDQGGCVDGPPAGSQRGPDSTALVPVAEEDPPSSWRHNIWEAITGNRRELERQLNGQKEWVEQLASKQRDAEKRLEKLGKRLDAFEGELAHAVQQLDGFRSALSRLQDDQITHHEELSREWSRLLNGEGLRTLVEEAVARARSTSLGHASGQSADAHHALLRAEALQLRSCADLLLAGEGFDRNRLEELLVPEGPDGERQRAALAELCDRADTLHRTASHLRQRPMFDFKPPKTGITPETATLYSPECGFGRRADILVLPAYRLGDQRLSLPVVLTTTRSGPAAPLSATTGADKAAPSGQGPA
ncbi:hypothetical protein ACIBCS_05925 [Streptomyces phaeochromogenes]|uniref:hypothetical protein n=1 Tax=Streptomyces phaeochromogenes TaxID=1923 RepID=UPI0034031D86